MAKKHHIGGCGSKYIDRWSTEAESRSPRRPLVQFMAALLGVILFAGSASANDLWPLVKRAESAVWGTVTDIEDGAIDRVITIEVTEWADEQHLGGSASTRLVERGGALACHTPITLGSTGLFLFDTAGASDEFHDVDAWLAADGYLPMTGDARTRARVTLLLSSRATEGAKIDAALDLLTDRNAPVRKLAVDWFRNHPVSIGARGQEVLAAAFADEVDSRVQHGFLELFLLRDWPLAGDRPATIVTHEEFDGLAVESALAYLERHSTPAARAHLVTAFPNVSSERRVVLLEAYARAQIEEATLWWQEALLGDDLHCRDAALQCLPHAKLDGTRDVYRALLRSDDPRVLELALRGLAVIGDREALEDYREQTDSREPTVQLVERILRYPHRYAKGR